MDLKLPEITTQFSLAGNKTQLWSLLNNPQELGKCIPGCEEVQVIGPSESKWKVKMSVGMISRRILANARVIEKHEPDKLVIDLRSQEGDITGLFTILVDEENGSNACKINLTAKIDARGSFQWIVNQVIKTQLDKFTKQFVECISNKAKS